MEKTEKQQKFREFSGVVSSASMSKTITVVVCSSKKHSKYDKRYKTNEKYHVHDEKGIAKVGDTVKFVECRPLSATKRWRLVEVIKN
jgi:small subunit ribosomal protein S17